MSKLRLIALAAVIVIFTGATATAQYRSGYYSGSPNWGPPYWWSGADTSTSGLGSPSGQSGGSPSAQYQTSGRGIAAIDGSVSGSASPSGQSGGSPSAQYQTSW